MATRITIIGAGPGGYTAAFALAKKGAEVTLVEAEYLGGTCLNCGCIPTKTLKASAEALDTVRRAAEFGIRCPVETTAVDMPSVLERKCRVTSTLAEGLRKTCAKLKVRLLMGRGRVVNVGLVRVTLSNGSTEEVTGDRIILAVGSKTLQLPSLPVDGKYILCSDDVLNLAVVPQTLTIAGGGVIGCELAFIFNSFGSKVTVVEGLDRLLPIPSVDEAMSKLLLREMKKKGIAVELCHTVNRTTVRNGKVQAVLCPSPFLENNPATAKNELMLESDAVFVTVGRVSNSLGLGLEEAGVVMDKRGYIVADEHLQTSVPGIYAVGDVLGPQRIMLAHMAAAEGIIAAENCLGGNKTVRYDVIPAGIFVSPEIATVGLTEAQAKAQGLDVVASEFAFRELGKAQAMGELPGMFKIVAEKSTGKVLGAHLAGAHATDIVAELALAMQMGATLEDVVRTVHAHPTLAEGVYEAAYSLLHSNF
jgi:dihydrolipoamide dehydrogenase